MKANWCFVRKYVHFLGQSVCQARNQCETGSKQSSAPHWFLTRPTLTMKMEVICSSTTADFPWTTWHGMAWHQQTELFIATSVRSSDSTRSCTNSISISLEIHRLHLSARNFSLHKKPCCSLNYHFVWCSIFVHLLCSHQVRTGGRWQAFQEGASATFRVESTKCRQRSCLPWTYITLHKEQMYTCNNSSYEKKCPVLCKISLHIQYWETESTNDFFFL